MAWTQADLDTLEAAIAAGSVLQRIRVGEQEYEFRSLQEMRDLAAEMRRGLGTTPSTRYAATSKGV